MSGLLYNTQKALDKLSVKEAAVLNKDGILIVNSKNKQGVNNYKYNSQIDMSEYTGYIDSQTKGNVRKLKLGNDTMNHNGCEVIATYNALVALGAKEDICKIAAHYESDGQILNGTWGTNPYAIERYFKQKGYQVSRVEGDNILQKKLPNADAYVVSFWNTDKVTGQLHTVAARKDESGEYVLYNYVKKNSSYDNDDSLQEIIASDVRQPILLLAIDNPKKD